MNCLCCGKPFRTESTQPRWHKSCIKKFFGTTELPEIAIDEKPLELLAAESTSKGYTVPVVQKKLSLHLFSEKGKPRLTPVNFHTGLDITELFLRLVFSFLVGNSDMHLKNFSLIEPQEGSGQYILSPAYDLLPVNVIMPEDKEQFALAVNGKKTNIRKKDFPVFAGECGISRSSAEEMIALLAFKKNKFIALCNDSLLPDHLKERFIKLIEERMCVLEN